MKYVIAPHVDDAFLSLGGSILNWIDNGEIVKIIYVFTKSSWTNIHAISNKKYSKDINMISALREAEEKEIQKITGHDVDYLGWYDKAHRGKKSKLVKFFMGKPKPFSEKRMVENIKIQLIDRIDKNSASFFPLALGEWKHQDHIILREIGLFLFEKGYNIHFYEDLPYFTHVRNKEEVGNLLQNVKFDAINEMIDMDKKMNLLNYYQSQMSSAWLDEVQKYGASMSKNKYYERYWKPVRNAKKLCV